MHNIPNIQKYYHNINIIGWNVANYLSDKIKQGEFQVVALSVLLYWCTNSTLTKRPKKKLHGNYKRMLNLVFKNILKATPYKKKHQYDHLPPISQTILVRRARHRGGESKDELMRDVFLRTPAREHSNVGGPAKRHILQLLMGTGCSLEELPGLIYDRDGWLERVSRDSSQSVRLDHGVRLFFNHNK